MGALNIAFKEVAGEATIAVASIAGSIDANTVAAFQKELEAARQNGKLCLVLDLSEVKYVNSTGLGSLVKEQDLFKSSGGTIILLKVPAKVKIVVEMLGLHTFFDMCDSMQEALATIKAAGGGSPTPAAKPKPDASVPTTKTQRLKLPAAPPKPATGVRSKSGKAPVKAPSSKQPAVPSSSRRAAVPAAGSQVKATNGAVACSVCNSKLDLGQAGTFKCPRCSVKFRVGKDMSVTFFGNDETVPVQMVLPATAESADGLFEFVGVVAKKLSFGGSAVRDFQRSVMEVCDKIRTEAYVDKDGAFNTFQVLISINGNKIDLTFADYGKALGGGNADKALVVLRGARAGVDNIGVEKHPSGGNIITLSKSF